MGLTLLTVALLVIVILGLIFLRAIEIELLKVRHRLDVLERKQHEAN